MNKNMKRISALVVSMITVASSMSVMAFGSSADKTTEVLELGRYSHIEINENSYKLTDANYGTPRVVNYTGKLVITGTYENEFIINGNADVSFKDVVIFNSIKVTGGSNANITFSGERNLISAHVAHDENGKEFEKFLDTAAIDVAENATANINVMKETVLVAEGGINGGAGIGGSSQKKCGEITLIGGKEVYAQGGRGAAGIGGGSNADGSNITIVDANVIADGGECGSAGIGGGTNGDGYNIVVTGSKIDITPKDGGAGIGGGNQGYGYNLSFNNSVIDVTGADIEGNSPNGGAAIGGGEKRFGFNINFDNCKLNLVSGLEAEAVGNGSNVEDKKEIMKNMADGYYKVNYVNCNENSTLNLINGKKFSTVISKNN